MKVLSQIHLAILASGSGTNAANLARHFRHHPQIAVSLIVSDNRDAYVLQRAKDAGIPGAVIPPAEWKKQEKVLALFRRHRINAIVLAGYLKLIPAYLIEMFPERILNIHPALLPAFGGRGMYGMRVHQAVVDAGVEKTGITIHLVNEKYDEGRILFQKALDVNPGETAESLSSKVQALEHRYYPTVVENYLLSLGYDRQASLEAGADL